MKIVGIGGKPGSGKTTLANMIGNLENVEILHLDFLWDEIKTGKNFKYITKNVKEKNQEHRVLDPQIIKSILKDKILSKIYFKFRKKIINYYTNKKLKEYERKNTKILIIEGIDLLNLDILKKLDVFVMLKAPYHKRIQRVQERDGIEDKQIVIEEEITSRKKVMDGVIKKPNLIIENDSDLKKLKLQAKDIINLLEYNEISEAKKYRMKNKISKSNLNKINTKEKFNNKNNKNLER